MAIATNTPTRKHFLCVFIADTNIKDDVVDVGNDPDFSKPPTWGICRPDVRRSERIGKGSYVVFVGSYPRLNAEKPYLVKGYMCVEEKISYLDALDRFATLENGNKKNVIVRYREDTSTEHIEWKPKTRWGGDDKASDRYKAITERDDWKLLPPDFITQIKLPSGKTLIQNPSDTHPTYNWKCQRIFGCQIRTLRKCIACNQCLKETEFLKEKGYLVSDKDDWRDVGQGHISWTELVNCAALERLRDRPLMNNANRHDEIELTEEEVSAICQALDEITTPTESIQVRTRKLP
jgi:hypothetical protein